MKNNAIKNKRKRRKRLVCPHNAGVKIAEKFNTTVQTVSCAMNFKTDSVLARNIRQYAINAYNAKIVYVD